MTSATLDKKHAGKEPTVPAGRAELAGAIERRRQCNDAVAAKMESISRARAGEDAALAEIEKCKAAIPRAKATDAAGAAKNLDKGKTPTTAWHLPSALGSLERAERDHEVVIAARAKLEEELVELEIDAAVAANGVIVARAKLLSPLIAATMARIRAARLEILKDRVLLATLLADKDAPEFPHDSRAFFKAREAEQARLKSRDAACGEMRDEAMADAAYLALIPTSNSMEEYTMAMDVAEQARRKLAHLLDDATAEIPEKM